MVGFQFNGEQSKDAASMAIRTMAKMPGIAYVVFLTDAWVAVLEGKQSQTVDVSRGVKNVPGRKEAIVASIFGRGDKADVGHWIYDRDKDGKPVFGEFEWTPNAVEFRGRFVPASTRKENLA